MSDTHESFLYSLFFKTERFSKVQVITKSLFTTLHSCSEMLSLIMLTILKVIEKTKRQESCEISVPFWYINFCINIV